MKRPVSTVLLCFTLIAGTLGPGAALADAEPKNLSNLLIESPASGPDAPASDTTLLDLSLFGIIALGVIGLLWIRRHTSEL